LNTVFAASYPDTQFVSSGGNTELDQRMSITIGIISKVLPTLEILLLKDRDMASGKPTTEVDRQLYLSNHADTHRVLKRWEIENYLYDREVLQAYCASQKLDFNEAAYASVVNDIDNDELKAQGTRIKNACGIVPPIDAEKFKRNLAAVIERSMAVYTELEDCIFRRS
jgi:hypothetical protein